ncbi:MAG: tetratricopeptide repeat protein [Phycisphaerae bacterium]|nr:tetratricopeptide repeat protein [Phycisphaerae bacterium]
MGKGPRHRTNRTATREHAAPGANGFWRRLVILCAVGAIFRIGILFEHVHRNPFAYSPVTDGAVYWEWAGRIANGQWLADTPFVSAPLYPYLLGAVRSLGGGLLAVYAIQLALDLLTAGMLGWIGQRRFGATVGLVAAVAWLIIDEPAFYLTRVLNSSVQAFLVTLLWLCCVRWQDRLKWPDVASVSVVLGLNCLANPPMMLLVVAVPVWMLVWARTQSAHQASRHPDGTAPISASVESPRTSLRVAGGQAGVCIALAILSISPATWHNWRVCGEFIPITACPGITLRQGNGAGAVGTYVAIPGISSGRESLFSDAARVYQQATGRPVRWKDVDSYFRDQALTYWREDPLRAAGLFLRRAYWFVSGRYYCDVHQPSWERDQGFARLLWLAPIPTAWLIGPGLIGLAGLARRPIRFGPEWLLLAAPLLVVVVFQYSPRYRFPAIPVLAATAAWACVQAARWKEHARWTIATAAALAGAIALGPINRSAGFDDPSQLTYNNEYNLSVALRKSGRNDEAVERLKRALAILPTSAEAHNDLGILLAGRRRYDEAIGHYEQALRSRPGWSAVENNLALAYATQGRYEEAIRHYRLALEANPDSPEIAFNLANALADAGRLDEARGQYDRVLELRGAYADARDHLAIVLARQNKLPEAIVQWQETLRIDPNRDATRHRLAVGLAKTHQYEPAIAMLRDLVRRCPADWSAANNLAWLLATCPQDKLRNGVEAVALAERICRQGTGEIQPAWLDSLAAAYAETGRFSEAAQVAEQALAMARRRGDSEQTESLAERLRLYQEGKPFREKG